MLKLLKKLFTKSNKNKNKSKTTVKNESIIPNNNVTNYIPPVHLYSANTDLDNYFMKVDPILEEPCVVQSEVFEKTNFFETIHTSSDHSFHSDTSFHSNFDTMNTDYSSSVDTSFTSDTSFSSD